jgi:hypothetical protein
MAKKHLSLFLSLKGFLIVRYSPSPLSPLSPTHRQGERERKKEERKSGKGGNGCGRKIVIFLFFFRIQ